MTVCPLSNIKLRVFNKLEEHNLKKLLSESSDFRGMIFNPTVTKEEKNITLKKWKRPKSLKEFAENPLFEKCAEETGFLLRNKNDDIKIGDVLLFENLNHTLSHVALYIGDQTILEHNIKQLSCRKIYDLNYIQATKKVYYYAA